MQADSLYLPKGYQSCTQTLHKFSARGIRSYAFSLEKIDAYCSSLFDIMPDTSHLSQVYGGYELADGNAVSNVIWSNGLLDPWHGGGFLKATSTSNDSSNHFLIMKSGAHHLDLRAPHPCDPEDVTHAREQEEMIIRGWIEAASIRNL